ncbi:MAG: extracellular solute-binding protein [Desulfobacterales bacterium]|nr:extracellular solute-binding protein [Desulfobacterales bacterium]
MKSLIFAVSMAAALVTGIWSTHPATAHSDALVVATTGNPAMVTRLAESYTRLTGTPVHPRTLSPKQIPSDADLILVDNVHTLETLKDQLLPVAAKSLALKIPQSLRDPDHHWIGLTFRGETLVFNSRKIKAEALENMDTLAQPRWKGRLLMPARALAEPQPTGSRKKDSPADPQAWQANLARPPYGDDTQTLEALALGEGDLARVSTASYIRFMAENPALSLDMFRGNSQGVLPVTISGAGVLKSSPKPQEAVRFLKWLTGNTAQKIMSNATLEYPANVRVRPMTLTAPWNDIITEITAPEAVDTQSPATL